MKIFKLILTVSLILVVNQVLLSAPPPPPAGSAGCWPPPCIPIDGGITFLAAAGAMYGAKKLYNSRKNKTKLS
jgi:hypothetical protein